MPHSSQFANSIIFCMHTNILLYTNFAKFLV